jgi:hypothetical protein
MGMRIVESEAAVAQNKDDDDDELIHHYDQRNECEERV